MYKQTRILLFHFKNMKFSTALLMFFIWRENLLSYDNMRFFFSDVQEVEGCDFSCEKNIHKTLLDLFRK